ncbi:nuclear transport factor 2 family protein [Lysinibacillus agricola]|uniref:Nuclear transport factor 2 family protein n=1 Tax=Lysinibacillus agricola TaxID=2590012 RepID=A0ABX7AR35_9BACI|nr:MULTISPECIES: nuclear transport factor 2 family protein [Lysinibacillus]KOS63145.1 cytochrome [Lysinibacillus sp. FJAT-14222]QQP12294.1 nuclear transport factor 2 family protein [Lysinibacillus agricola]
MKREFIIEYEERLRQAMLNGDVKALEELIDDNLIFVNHFGQILTKEADIEAYRSGILSFTTINFLDQKIILLENSAVTVTRATLKGTFGTEPIEDEMCYSRVWKQNGERLIIVSGHCSSVPK